MATEHKKAVVLLSGGLDSSTCLAWARDNGYECYALTVSYGQRHTIEIDRARQVAKTLGAADHKLVTVNLGDIADSALTNPDAVVPKDRDHIGSPGDVPVTYVPARNLVMLSLALSWAESIDAHTLIIGTNVLDYSGYPDCRPEFLRAFEAVAQQATRAGGFEVQAPLMDLHKKDIIRLGTSLGLDYGMTISCYDPGPDGAACGHCDACVLRREGFEQAGVPDPTPYMKESHDN